MLDLPSMLPYLYAMSTRTTPAAKPVGVILAGGRATRMGGGDKCLVPLGGQPLLTHIIAAMRPQLSALALNANGDPARFDAFGLKVIADAHDDRPGPLAGLFAAMEWAAGLGQAHVLTVSGDTPFLPRDLVARLAQSPRPAIAASPDETGKLRLHPTIGLWPVALRDRLQEALSSGERRIGFWANSNGAELVAFTDQPDPFFNINTPEDLVQAQLRLR